MFSKIFWLDILKTLTFKESAFLYFSSGLGEKKEGAHKYKADRYMLGWGRGLCCLLCVKIKCLFTFSKKLCRTQLTNQQRHCTVSVPP